jgi:hypothetical protein
MTSEDTLADNEKAEELMDYLITAVHDRLEGRELDKWNQKSTLRDARAGLPTVPVATRSGDRPQPKKLNWSYLPLMKSPTPLLQINNMHLLPLPDTDPVQSGMIFK